MHAQERQAWFVTAVIAATFVLYFGIVAVMGFHPAAMGAFGLAGLLGLMPLFGRKARKEGKVVMDERDLEIGRAGTIAGYSVFWLLFVAVAMLLLYRSDPEGNVTIHVSSVSGFVFSSLFTVYLVRSIVILLLYRRGRHA